MIRQSEPGMLLSRSRTVKRKILKAKRGLWITLARFGHSRSGHGGEEKKQQSVRGYVHVEIGQTVEQ